jgi:hypothetical protein
LSFVGPRAKPRATKPVAFGILRSSAKDTETFQRFGLTIPSALLLRSDEVIE